MNPNATKYRRYQVPPNAPPAKCRSCGAAILWVTDAGKHIPVSVASLEDGWGVSHFTDCPHASEWRKNKPHDLETQVLATLKQKPYTLQQIARMYGMTPAAASVIIEELKKTNNIQPIVDMFEGECWYLCLPQ